MSDEWQPGFDGQRAMTVLAWIAGFVFLAFAAVQIHSWWSLRPLPSHDAHLLVRDLQSNSVAYFETHAQFPDSTPLHPELGCDRHLSTWNTPTWRALRFEIDYPQRYSFQYDSSGAGSGARFTASAFGDLDCDGIASTFVRFGSVREIEVEDGPTRLRVISSAVDITNEPK